MSPEPFSVAPHGEKWAVVSGSQVLALAADRQAAAALAAGATRILLGALDPPASPGALQAAAEPRSFAPTTDRAGLLGG